MHRTESWPRSGVTVFVLAAVLGVGIRLWISLTGWNRDFLIADDAYYYFTIAQNILAGHGSTFDGLAPTNGYHPLWLASLVLAFPLAGDSLWGPVCAAQCASALLDLGSGWVMFRTLRRCGWDAEAGVATAVWFLSPVSILIGLRGMEASLSTLLILLFSEQIAVNGLDASASRWKMVLYPGMLLGLAGLARTDNVPVLSLAMVATSTVYALAGGPDLRIAIVRSLQIGAVAFLIMVPWFVWNQVTFGSILQVSGQVKLYSRRIFGALGGNPSGTPIGAIVGFIKSMVAPVLFPIRFVTAEEFTKTPTLTLGILGGMSVLLGAAAWNARRRLLDWIQVPSKARFLLFALCYMVIHTLLFALVWRAYATWYALPTFAFLSVILGLTLSPAAEKAGTRSRIRFAPIMAAVLTGLAAYSISLVRIRTLPEASSEAKARQLAAIASHYHHPVVAGAWNAGSWSWMAREHPQIRIVNLDGLVNNQAFQAVKRGQYGRYVAETVDLLLENPKWGGALFLNEAQTDSLADHFEWDGVGAWAKRSAPGRDR